jgi:hypothetical protein
MNIHCRTMHVITKKTLNPLSRINCIYRRTECHALEQKHLNNGVFKLGEEIIRKKEMELSENVNSKMSDDSEDSYSKPLPFIDLLFKNPGLFSREQQKDEVNVMIFAVFLTHIEGCFFSKTICKLILSGR